jgi:hypothetical protein
MFGLSKEQVLGCIGPPASKAAEGQIAVWSYNSGDGTTIASGWVLYGNFSGVSSRRSVRSMLLSRVEQFRPSIKGLRAA